MGKFKTLDAARLGGRASFAPRELAAGALGDSTLTTEYGVRYRRKEGLKMRGGMRLG